MKLLVSVIVPIYNVEKYLHRCVDSIINQTYKNIEIILVDDGSLDNSPAICDEYLKKDNRIKVIHKENGGPSDSRNNGLDVATGDYFTFVDSDDFIKANYVEILLKLCIDYNCELSQGDFEKGNKDKFSILKEGCINVYNNVEIFKNRKLVISPWAKLYKAVLFNDIRFPVGKKYEDDFITWKLGYKSKNIATSTEKIYYYYESQGSIMRAHNDYLSIDFIEAYQERLDFFLQKNEIKAYNYTLDLFCLTLMLFYIKCKKNSNNTNDKKQLYSLFLAYSKIISTFSELSFSHKVLFFIFKVFPNISSFFVNLLNLRKQ